MKKFFVLEDFDTVEGQSLRQRQQSMDCANAKLEREGLIVYTFRNDVWWKPSGFTNQRPERMALLIGAEDIPPECNHEKQEKKSSIKYGETWYKCANCGIDLKPLTFGPT